jgi:hypothetical protein
LEFRCETINHKVMWIPCFDLHEQHIFDTPNILSDIKINNTIEEETFEYYIKDIKQVSNISMNYDSNISTNFKIAPASTDIVLDDAFLIACINYDILSDINIPAIMISIITKESWIKSK